MIYIMKIPAYYYATKHIPGTWFRRAFASFKIPAKIMSLHFCSIMDLSWGKSRVKLFFKVKFHI
jgi:hypothetical protein